MKQYHNLFEQITSVENLFGAWQTFQRDKQTRPDVLAFAWDLEPNLFALQREFQAKRYRHAPYSTFWVQDPKQRLIHKATVRDRVVHHAVFRVIIPLFEETFIANSFSCRVGKGTHRGVATLSNGLRQVSRNSTRPCWALKCDIRKFFHSIDHQVLLELLSNRIRDDEALWLLRELIGSFESSYSLPGQPKGLPLGNLTSQLFGNIVMNEFDQFVKHTLRVKHYVRYTDDFVLVDTDSGQLASLIEPIQSFLARRLKLTFHPNKISLRKFRRGIDFLGYVILPHHTVLRTKTKQRMLGRVTEENLPSYLGLLQHANAYGLIEELKAMFPDQAK